MTNYSYKTTPYRYQKEGFNYLYGKKFGALFMEQGTGKSKTIIDIVSNLYLEKKIDAVLLIAPNSVHLQWHEEQIPEHSPVEYCSKYWKSSRSKIYDKDLENFFKTKDEKSLKWFCINIEVFSMNTHLDKFRNYVKNNNTAIILDEATTIKNPNSNRAYNIIYNLGELKKRGRRVLNSIHYSKYRFILTGTMVTNSPYDLWAMFEFLEHGYFNMSYYSFRNTYGIERTDSVKDRKFNRSITQNEIMLIRNKFNNNQSISLISAELGITETNIKYILNNPDLTIPYKNLEELKNKIKPYSFIIRKKDCLDLPEKVYTKLPVELSNEQKKIYKELQREYITQFQNKELSVQNKISLLIRLSQITGGFFPYVNENGKKVVEFKSNAKLEALKRDIYETTGKIIIFSRFTAEIDLLSRELQKSFPEKNIEVYYGKTDAEKRNKIKENFKIGTVDILIGNPTCAGVGLNLQKANLVYYYSNSFSLYYREQSEDRVHRIGQDKTVIYKDIIAKDTIDEKIYKILREKKDLLEYFRDHTINDFLITY